MKWSARGVAAMPYDGPLQLLVMRHQRVNPEVLSIRNLERRAIRRPPHGKPTNRRSMMCSASSV
jgi:hypothetical protein